MLIHRLLASTALRAPNDDQGGGGGSEVDPAELPLEPLDPDLELDFEEEDLDPDAELEEQTEEASGNQGASPAREPSRTDRAVAELRRRTQEAEQRAADAERRANEALQARTHQTASERQAEEARRLAEMEPWERIEYRQEQQERRHAADMAQQRFETQDRAERAEFAARCTKVPAFAAVEADVEAELAKLRASGQTVAREVLATYLIGRRAIDRAGKARPRAQREASEARQSQAARPTGGRSDVRTGGGRNLSEKEQRAARLADLEI